MTEVNVKCIAAPTLEFSPVQFQRRGKRGGIFLNITILSQVFKISGDLIKSSNIIKFKIETNQKILLRNIFNGGELFTIADWLADILGLIFARKMCNIKNKRFCISRLPNSCP